MQDFGRCCWMARLIFKGLRWTRLLSRGTEAPRSGRASTIWRWLRSGGHLLPFSTPGLSCRRRHAGRNAFAPRNCRRNLDSGHGVRRTISCARARMPARRRSRGAAARLCQRGGPNALCLSWRHSGPDSQPYPRRTRVVRALARNRDLVTDRPQSRRCNAADRGALARARLRAITRPGSIHARRQMRAAPHLL